MRCSRCKKEKVGIDNGRRKARNNYIVLQDASGRCWNCKVCPDCRYGTEPDPIAEPGTVETRGRPAKAVVMGTRKCTFCHKLLPTDRRFFHKECYNDQEYMDWNELYVVRLG